MIDIIKNHIKLILFSIFSAFIIISNTLAIAQFDQTIFSNDFSFDKKFVHSKGWRHLTLNGFDSKTNIATRGMAIYNNELYIGTQNTKFPKFFQNTVPELLEIISKFIPNKLPEFLHRTTAFKILLRVVHLLSRVTVKLVMHSAVKNSQGCEIWRYNYSTDTLTQVIGDNSIYGINSGFNYSFNCLASVLTVFKNKLYVSTWSTPIGSLDNPYRNGCEIWCFDGIDWSQVVGHNAPHNKGGFSDSDNVGICSMKVFDNYLYASTMNWDPVPYSGFEIWRSKDGIFWEEVVTNGFKQNMSRTDLLNGVTNTYGWCMEAFQDHLYVGTYNSCYRFLRDTGMGCQLWRTKSGTNWTKVDLPTGKEGIYQDGFGEPENYGIRTMIVYNDELYVGTATNLLYDKGFEIWKFNGEDWKPVIGDDVPGINNGDFEYSGFGNPLNNYAWSMNVTSDNKLWVGTANGRIQNLLEPVTVGGEMWCFDGSVWKPIVKNDIGEKPNGFGNIKNEGIRSIIEYPQQSGNIIVGTFKLISTRPLMPQEGCEVWIRNV